MKGTIIITGGTGLLGTSLVTQLVKNGYFCNNNYQGS